jgi:two-component system OmpR family response regulator
MLNEDLKLAPESMRMHVRNAIPLSTEGRALRVLVVDDYPDSADFLAKFLICHGHIVQVCYEGAAALVTALQFHPHVCILDIAMPGMDGLELAARLKVDVGMTPLVLIAITAYGEWEIRTQTAIAGFHYHFAKPVDLQALAEAITDLGKLFGSTSPELGPSRESLMDEALSLPESLV